MKVELRSCQSTCLVLFLIRLAYDVLCSEKLDQWLCEKLEILAAFAASASLAFFDDLSSTNHVLVIYCLVTNRRKPPFNLLTALSTLGRAQLGGCCRFGSWLILHQSCGSLWGTLEERASCLVHRWGHFSYLNGLSVWQGNI